MEFQIENQVNRLSVSLPSLYKCISGKRVMELKLQVFDNHNVTHRPKTKYYLK